MALKPAIQCAVAIVCAIVAFRGWARRIRIPGAGLARRFARHRSAVCLGAALAVLLLRALLLPVWPVPKPSIYDEFAYLLQADTFAHGRLTNPAHPLWQFFESIYILQQPTYAAKYPPGQGLAMAVGRMLLQDPWFGVWLSCGAPAAALCWALPGWVPPRWRCSER